VNLTLARSEVLKWFWEMVSKESLQFHRALRFSFEPEGALQQLAQVCLVISSLCSICLNRLLCCGPQIVSTQHNIIHKKMEVLCLTSSFTTRHKKKDEVLNQANFWFDQVNVPSITWAFQSEFHVCSCKLSCHIASFQCHNQIYKISTKLFWF
jgi:hypothetical protein